MALIYCPECGHEISNSAVACPNCGRPVNARPVVERRVVVADAPKKTDGVPTWAAATLGVMGILILFFLFVFWGRGSADEGNQRLRVNVNTERPVSGSRPNADDLSSSSSTFSSPASQPSYETSVPGSQTTVSTKPTRGSVVIDAKVIARNNNPQPVRNEKFYLLDKDLETILSDAGVEPIEGQTLTNSLGLGLIYPDRYGDFSRRAMQAIQSHVKYAGTTNNAGKLQLGGVQPESYYLFGMTRTDRGFAIWSSPVNIQPGENILNVSPQPLTEIDQTSG